MPDGRTGIDINPKLNTAVIQDETSCPLWKNRAYMIILLVNFCHQFSQQMMNTLVPKYVFALGATSYVVGLVSSMFAVASFLIRPIASPAFDSFSKKKLLIASMVGLLITYIGYALSETVAAVLCFRFLHGVCIGCISPLSLAIASDSIPNKQIGKGIGFFTLCQAFGQAVGPSIGLNLSKTIGYSITFFVGAIVIFAGLFAAFFVVNPEYKPEPYRMTLKKIIEPNSIHPAVIMFFQMFSYMCISSYLVIYAEMVGVENIGLYFTVYAVFLLATRPVSGILLDRFGYVKVLVPSMLFFALSFVIMSSAHSIRGFITAAVINAFGYGVCYPTMQSLVMSCTDREKRGVAASTGFIGIDIGSFLGPFCVGLFIDAVSKKTGNLTLGYSWGLRISMVPVLMGIAYFLMTWKKIKANLDKYCASERE